MGTYVSNRFNGPPSSSVLTAAPPTARLPPPAPRLTPPSLWLPRVDRRRGFVPGLRSGPGAGTCAGCACVVSGGQVKSGLFCAGLCRSGGSRVQALERHACAPAPLSSSFLRSSRPCPAPAHRGSQALVPSIVSRFTLSQLPARHDLLLYEGRVLQHRRVFDAREGLGAPRLERVLPAPLDHCVGALVVLGQVAQRARCLPPHGPVRVLSVAHVAEEHRAGAVKRALQHRFLGEVGEAGDGEDLGGGLEQADSRVAEEVDEDLDDAAAVHCHPVLGLGAQLRERPRRLEHRV
mmetsp:Transcript_68563/g.190816  ORF Transcript_68563/g.190816 Transcript_68563/m.190816 type:complete len:292 (+) Transcript_68563:1657-2532(+)